MEPAEPNDWLVGGGEMGELIRAMDWSKTTLGRTESWPSSLRTAVSICLGSRHPIVLWLGPERSIFYNDAYRPMLGDRKPPQFLGRSGQECWAEIWDIVGPMMVQVIDTGKATWSEDLFLLMLRHGYLEETHFTFSYSPIRDERGRPRGVFCACTESTSSVLGERRLKALRSVVEARTIWDAARCCAEAPGQSARDIPFALVYLLDDAGKKLELVGHSGLGPGTPASTLAVDMAMPHAGGWPLARIAAQGHAETLDDLATRFAAARWSRGTGLGLFSVRERAIGLGGRFQVLSTRATARAPSSPYAPGRPIHTVPHGQVASWSVLTVPVVICAERSCTRFIDLPRG